MAAGSLSGAAWLHRTRLRDISFQGKSRCSTDHEQAVIAYLTHTMSGQSEMMLLFEAIDLLDQAIAVIENSHFNFRM